MYTNDYLLTEDNYHIGEFGKTQIVIGHTSNSDMRHHIGWTTRNGGEYTKTAMFTVDLGGKIHRHFDPEYYSDFVNIKGVDEHIITIVLENEGWLIPFEDKFFNWIGSKYKRKSKVVEVNWRDKKYWAPYTKKQMSSLVKLCKELCAHFDIPLKCIGHNTFDPEVINYKGIVFRSNYIKESTDVSPAMDFNKLKNKIEIN